MHNNPANTIRGRDGWANMQKRAANVVFETLQSEQFFNKVHFCCL